MKCPLPLPSSSSQVRPGIAYHLYSKRRLEALADFAQPEMLRTPLDELCLHVSREAAQEQCRVPPACLAHLRRCACRTDKAAAARAWPGPARASSSSSGDCSPVRGGAILIAGSAGEGRA